MKNTINVLIVAAFLVMSFGVMTASAADPTISPWTTGIDLQNLASVANAYMIEFYSADGTLAYTYSPATPLPANGSANVYIPSVTGMPAGQFAGVVSSEKEIAAVTSLNSYASNNPQFGGGDIYIGTSAPANSLVFPLVYRNHTARRYYSSLSIQNASASAQTVTLKLYNNGQSTAAVTKNVPIPANGSYTFNLQEATTYDAFGPFGSATVTGSGPLAGVASALTLGRMTNPNTNYVDTLDTLYRAFTSAQFGRDVTLPLAYKNYNSWTTGINVVNTTATATNVTVTYTNANPAITGGPWTETVAVGPNAMQTVYTPSNANLPDKFYGSATVHSNSSDIAVVVASQRYLTSGAQGVAYEGSLATQATNCASLPVTHNRTTWKTGINLLNLGNAASTYTLKYFDSGNGGALVKTQDVPIPAHSPKTVYMPTDSGTAVGFYGAVDIHGTQPVLVNVANSRSDPASHGVASNYVGINYTCP